MRDESFGQSAVEAAASITLEVEGDELVSDRAQPLDDLFPQLEGSRKVPRLQFQACECVMVSNAKAAEAEFAQCSLRRRHLSELLDCDRRTVRKARGEAGIGGLVPGPEAEFPAQFADFLLGQSHLSQWMSDTEIASSAEARAVVVQVVSIRPVDDCRESSAAASARSFPYSSFLQK